MTGKEDRLHWKFIIKTLMQCGVDGEVIMGCRAERAPEGQAQAAVRVYEEAIHRLRAEGEYELADFAARFINQYATEALPGGYVRAA